MTEFSFDTVADEYRTLHDENVKSTGANSAYFCEFKVKKSSALLKDVKVDLILDIGCGDGLSEVYFDKHFLGVKVIGIDTSRDSIKVAQSRNLPNATYRVTQELPQLDVKPDLIFVSNVIHHLKPDMISTFLKYCINNVSEDGEVHIYEHNPYNPVTRKIVNDCIFDVGIELVRANKLRNLATKLGARNTEIQYLLFFPRHKIFEKLIGYEKYMAKIPLGGQYMLRIW